MFRPRASRVRRSLRGNLGTTPVTLKPLAERLFGADAAIALDTAHGELALARRRAQGQRLRQHGFSRAYVLPNSFK